MQNSPCPFRLQRLCVWMKVTLWSGLGVLFLIQPILSNSGMPSAAQLYAMFASPILLLIVILILVIGFSFFVPRLTRHSRG